MKLPSNAEVKQFIRDRVQVMLRAHERSGAEVPDPTDLLPANWRELPDEHKLAAGWCAPSPSSFEVVS